MNRFSASRADFATRALFAPLLTAALLFLLPAQAATAQAKDIPGAADHPLVGRYEGSAIHNYTAKGYEEVVLLDRAVDERGRDIDARRFGVDVAGKYTRIVYRGPETRSILEVMRNYQERLRAEGFAERFACRRQECGIPTSFWTLASAGGGFLSQWDTNTYALFHKPGGEADVWVALFGIEAFGSGNRPLLPILSVTVVETTPMETGRIVFVDAETMHKELAASGRIALYGIEFDFDSDRLRAESEPTLLEIASFLRQHPDVSLVVTGHTDATGRFDYNVDLSRRRAAAVVTALTSRHDVAAQRLTPFGAGMAAPVASNDHEEGRARNRRVELVKR